MRESIAGFVIPDGRTILEALKLLDQNHKGFLLVTDAEEFLLGTLTDGDIRRAFIRGKTPADSIDEIYMCGCRVLHLDQSVSDAAELFKNESIKFLPVTDADGRLVNVLTKSQMHSLMLQDLHVSLDFDFTTLDENIIDHEIFIRPWGFYKTTVMNDYFQAKVISVNPLGQLSLQSHQFREEHWIVAHGTGTVQLDDSVLEIHCGSSVFIPKGCRHRLTNTDEKECLIITEVQIGSYFGEDDIRRYEDIYGRV